MTTIGLTNTFISQKLGCMVHYECKVTKYNEDDVFIKKVGILKIVKQY